MPVSTVEPGALARDARVDDETLTVELADGRTISVPIVWFPRLAHASPAARNAWVLLGDGRGVHWPDADEDVRVEGLLTRSMPR